MDKHIPNEKELIRPRRFCLRREIPEPGAHNLACGANYLAARWFVVPAAHTTRTRHYRGAILYFCGEY